MTTEAKIREAFEKSIGKPLCLDTELDAWGETRYIHSHIQALFNGYRAGYIALLNELELGDWCRDCDGAPLYALPEGVTKC